MTPTPINENEKAANSIQSDCMAREGENGGEVGIRGAAPVGRGSVPGGK
ncbi:hypothetical protein IC580_10285 [Cupriavidus sp. ISTL7]|nr:hypothetical protein IC580_10285 [Cupriavidus sp. ISTL7]